MIAKLTRVYIRTYSDSGQVTAYAEWIDTKSRTGRTEGPPANLHMQALISRGKREGLAIEQEVW